jgi:hypothetical protein
VPSQKPQAPTVRCGRCKHVLTDPVSIKIGYGMTCLRKLVKSTWSYQEVREMTFRLLMPDNAA